MSATAYQRRRRVTALQEQCEVLGIDCSGFGMDELKYKAAIEAAREKGRDPQEEKEQNYVINGSFDDGVPISETQEPATDANEIDEEAIRALAKELGIKSYHLKNIEKLQQEIAEVQKGGE